MASVASAQPLPALVDLREQRALRRVSAATLITSCGNGAWYTCWALFLTRSVGLSPAQAGIGITAAGGAGLIASAPLGRLADRFGTVAVLVPISLLQAAGFAAYLRVHDLSLFLPVAVATVATDRGSIGVRSALALQAAAEERQLRALAVVRVASSVGFALGSALGGVAIAIDSHAAYEAVALLNAASFVAYALIVVSLPVDPGRARSVGRSRGALRDLAYLTLAAITGVLALCWGMLSSGVPLWVARHTLAPLWISALIVVLNALTIAALQIRITTRVTSTMGAARSARWAGCALAVSCVLFALSQNRGGAPVLLLLLGGAAVHVAGELLFVAACWRLSVDLMPAGAPGEYQGVFATGQATAQMIAPVLMMSLVVDWGAAGWLLLAGVFALAVLPAVPSTRWAMRTRPIQSAVLTRRLASAPGANRTV
jgi:MFS family permease